MAMEEVRKLLYSVRPQHRINSLLLPLRGQRALQNARAPFCFCNYTICPQPFSPSTGALICFLVWLALYFYSLPCLLERSKPDGSFSLQSLGFPISMNQAKFAFSLLPIFPALKFSLLIYTDLSLPCLLRGFTPQAIMLPRYLLSLL